MSNRGYTLIELMVVICIISILATLSLPSMHRSIIRARETSLRHTLFVFRDVIDQYAADNGRYPETLDQLVEKKYIRAVPKDPFTNSASTWIVIPPEGEDEGGVYDVHSGTNLVSLNGEPYNDW